MNNSCFEAWASPPCEVDWPPAGTIVPVASIAVVCRWRQAARSDVSPLDGAALALNRTRKVTKLSLEQIQIFAMQSHAHFIISRPIRPARDAAASQPRPANVFTGDGPWPCHRLLLVDRLPGGEDAIEFAEIARDQAFPMNYVSIPQTPQICHYLKQRGLDRALLTCTRSTGLAVPLRQKVKVMPPRAGELKEFCQTIETAVMSAQEFEQAQGSCCDGGRSFSVAIISETL
jgi:hypothetical protein